MGKSMLKSILVLGLCFTAMGASPSPPAPPPSSSPPASPAHRLAGSCAMPLLLSSAVLGLTASRRTALSFSVLVVFAAAFLQGAAAQVAEQKTTVADPTAVIAAQPKIDCSVTWSESWTKCSPGGKQTRRYTVDVYPTRTGKQCPAPQTQSCTYAGPQTIMIDGKAGTWGAKDCAQRRAPAAERKMLGYPGETHETFVMSGMCQYDAIKVTVGDVLVFKKSQASDDVFAVPSQWHYAECNFTDGRNELPADASSTASEFRYTIRAQDTNTRLYLASSRESACSAGQRVLVSVDDFKQGTLAEVVHLINTKTYNTEKGAVELIERIWCFEDHCPMPAMGFYEGNAEWSKERCKADAFSLLGFVYRKRPVPQIQRAEMYYKKALALVPTHCEATEYMGELYIQIGDFATASTTFTRLESLEASEKTAACTNSLGLLQAAWNKEGWCPPPVNSKTACMGSASASSPRAVMMSVSSLFLVTFSGLLATVF